MAFFKLRKAAAEAQQAPGPAPESVETLRRRARYRLAGAALLVLAGVVGFPILFDNQPRPIAVDIPIDIPDKAKVAPLEGTAQPETRAPAHPPLAAAPPVAPASTPVAEPPREPVAAKPVPKEQPREEVIIPSAKPAAKAEDRAPAAKSADKAAEKAPDKASAGRFIVQFGAFSDAAHAHEVRMKVERTGLKTYAQVIEGAEGKKYRVRVGPFEKRSDAERAAEKIRKLDLPAAILGL